MKRIEDIEAMSNDGNYNEEQIEQPSQSDSNRYALPSHYNDPYHYSSRNNYHY